MPRPILIDTRAIITALTTSLIVGAVGGAWGYGRLIESSSALTHANAQEIEELKENQNRFVTKEYFELIINRLDRIESKIDREN